MVVTRRSSQRLLKKAKLEDDQEVATTVVEISDESMEEQEDDDDDFQDPIVVLRREHKPVKKERVKKECVKKEPTRQYQLRTRNVKSESSSSRSASEQWSSGLWSRAVSESSGSSILKNEDDDDIVDEDEEDSSAIHSAADSPCLALTEFVIDPTTQLDDEEVDQLTQEDDDDDQVVDVEVLQAGSAVEDESTQVGQQTDAEQINEINDTQLHSDLEHEEEHNDADEEQPTRTNRRAGERRPPVRRNIRQEHYKRTQEKILRQHEELKHVWTDLESIESAAVIPVEQPPELTLSLLPFQKYGVGWMIQQESVNTFRGGILADEMGMGKTIQTIALLLSDKKKPNLVIAPTVAILQWKSEIERHTNNALSVHVYHGAKRITDPKKLKNFDVVLSTYSIMETAFRRQEYGVKRKDGISSRLVKGKSVLHQVNWHRIILDEAHNIKDRSNNTARSVFNMNAKYKWSLTGTPLQNRVGELYSLIRFMQADPFAYYYCKECPCKELTWKFSNKKGCDTCGHTPMNHTCWWNNEVLKPIQIHGYVGDGRVALEKLRLLLDRIMLRRTKVECADDLGLPPRTVICRRDIFNDEEEDLYTSLYSDVARTFTTYVEEGTVLNNYANIFELLTKMRQCADHPDLVTKKSTDNKQLVCMLCNDPPEDAISAACKHVFCRECCVQYYNSFDDSIGTKPRCPSCFAEFSVDLSQPALESEGGARGSNANYAKSSIVNRINMDKWRSSTKIEALVEELSKLRREDKTIKSIVFSQFVNFLDLVYWRLSRAGFECIRLDGTMSPAQRDAAIKHFMTKPTVTVFLISLKAGGVALNLTEASRVFICDPWWNPAAELQAMDRIHRLGQHRPIRITRLIIENSIESRIVQLQEKKTALVESTVGKNSSALDKLTVEDLRFLFVM